jgi:hypothetical protein
MWVDGTALRLNGHTRTIDENSVITELEDAVAEYYQNI